MDAPLGASGKPQRFLDYARNDKERGGQFKNVKIDRKEEER